MMFAKTRRRHRCRQLHRGSIMRCPKCVVHILENWQTLYTINDATGTQLKSLTSEIPNEMEEEGTEQRYQIVFAWMQCPNEDCKQILAAAFVEFTDEDNPDADYEGMTIIYPERSGGRAVDPAVPEKMASDYREAAAIVDQSPKASAAIARRLLADVLEEYGGYKDFQLSKRIEKFAADAKHPSGLRENAKYLVQLGDFAAHTQKDKLTQQIVDVEPGEADWTLDVIDGLFDFFIVGPKRDADRRAALDDKIQRTGRKPIK